MFSLFSASVLLALLLQPGQNPNGDHPAQSATLVLKVPPNARVYLRGKEVPGTRALRIVTVGNLAQGNPVPLRLEVRFADEGRAVTMTRLIVVRAGQRVELDFQADAEKDRKLVDR